MNIRETLQKVIGAKMVKDERKQRWLALIAQGDEEKYAAKEAFLAADKEFYAAGQKLSDVLSQLDSMQVLDLVIGSLDGDLVLALHRLVETLSLHDLVEPQVQRMSLPDLVRAVRAAGRTVDAAVRLNEMYLSNELREFELVLGSGAAYRDEEAWQKAVSAFRFIQANLQVDAGDAALMCIRRFRCLQDKLMGQLQLEAEERIAHGTFGTTLAEMELDLARYLDNLVENGLARQPQLATAAKPRARSPAVLDKPTRSIGRRHNRSSGGT